MKNQINTGDLNCEIEKKGKKINCGTGTPIKVEYNGEGLIKGSLILDNGNVIRIKKK